jgi:uncharacterized damage-inducible protein DinB
MNPSPKQQFLSTFKDEHARTMKVLRAFPADQSEFRPHPRSQSARELAFTFVLEQQLMMLALTDQLKLGSGMPKAPEDFQTILDQFEADFEKTCQVIESTSEESFVGTTVKFFAGKGQMADFPKVDFCWFMLMDQIHHRGQYSVYLRMAGGKVPAIYGPSADEPWT